MKVGIIAALPGELKPLVKDWNRVKPGDSRVRKWVRRQGEDEWVAVCAGMGADAARKAFAEAEQDGDLEMVLSVGWVGALRDDVAVGGAYIPSVVIDALTGEQFRLVQGNTKWRLVTTAHIAGVDEKRRLASTYPGAGLVDMEAATVARLAEMRNVPLICIKGVSDEVGVLLPNLNQFVDQTGHLRMLPFLGHVFFRPRFWPALMHLGRNSARAARAMRDLIIEFMREKNVDQLIRTGSI
jgi:adenosylhomocysteine nucleosidase